VTRTICNTGQGVLCIEDFREFKVVFDCGSLTKPPKDIIDVFFSRTDYVKAVFISHLDADHVNCLCYLINFCHVERVFIPLISDEEYVIVQCRNLKSGGKNLVDFVDMLRSGRAPKDQTRVVTVRPTPLSGGNEQDINNESFNISRNMDDDRKSINSGTEVVFSGFGYKGESSKDRRIEQNWVFQPFNFYYPKNHTTLMRELKYLGFNVDDMDSIPHEIAKRISDKCLFTMIKGIYKFDLAGSINSNSMVVYSGARCTNTGCHPVGIHFYVNHHCAHHCDWCRMYHSHISDKASWDDFFKCGCLYTGDFDANGSKKWTSLKERYKDYWNNIGLMQLPHHGSRYSFNREIAMMNAIFFVCAGYRNAYGHPHDSVVNFMQLTGNPFYWVNEEPISCLEFEIDCSSL